ncbi:hypothetical protein AN958_00666 [Leucoagaricus sp. SymC.cos]|nr:hypothetical protein AN958_00666 [Leucoagaricus sp. SymC.cos]
MTSLLSTFLIFLLLLSSVSAQPRNVTIDDQKGDEVTGLRPNYEPPFAWATESCVGCKIRPDFGQLWDQTAMQATFMPDNPNVTSNTIDFNFTGTAIYIFFTLFENEGVGVTVNTECNFTIDGGPPAFFNHSGDPTKPVGSGRQYGVPVFNQTGLEQEQHHIQIKMSDVNYHVFLSFDRAIYTTDSDPVSSGTSSPPSIQGATVSSSNMSSNIVSSGTNPSSTSSGSSSSNGSIAGIVVGGVIGGIAVLAGFVALLYYYRRDSRRYRPSSPGPFVPRPFGVDPSSRTEQGIPGPSSRTAVNSTPGPGSITSFPYTLPSQSQSSGPGSSGSSSSRSRSGSGSQGSVEHRIRAANQRMRSLRAEMASVSGSTGTSSRSRSSRAETARVMEELMEEVKRLRQELQALKQLQRQQSQARPLETAAEEPPPDYTDDISSRP